MKYYKLNFNWRLLGVPKMHSSEIHNMPCSPSLAYISVHICNLLFFNCLSLFVISFLYGISNRAVFTPGLWNRPFSLEPDYQCSSTIKTGWCLFRVKLLMCCENCIPCPIFTCYALLKLQPLASETYGLCVEGFTVFE